MTRLRSGIAVFSPFSPQKPGAHRQSQKFGHNDGEPDAVRPHESGQHQNHGCLEHQRAQERDNGGNKAVVQRCKEAGAENVEACEQERKRIQTKAAAGHRQQRRIIAHEYLCQRKSQCLGSCSQCHSGRAHQQQAFAEQAFQLRAVPRSMMVSHHGRAADGITDENGNEKTIEQNAPKCHLNNRSKIGQHANQTLADAIKNSCNYYFCEAAYRLGIDKLNEWAGKFGLTSRTGIELTGETEGIVGGQKVLFDNTLTGEDGTLDIVEGRHPVVEQTMSEGGFVPNDTHMNADDCRMCIITGPNMAGKSTYMRQVALIALMAHIGSFVPAKEAKIPVTDRIFTRVGASDDLASGQSTFMVEMSETAYILRNATAKSLVILDEIGRGTSTFDGLAIAWAVVEYLCDKQKSGAKTLFATHYHELSELEGHIDGVQNYCISVKEHGEDVIFLRKIIRGGADKSFGIHVARLAGVPHPVLVRAHEIQARLEVSDINQHGIGQNILGDAEKRKDEQVNLFDYRKTEIINELQTLDVMALTPMDAINKLFLLREKARKL